jgi:RimJ/RimL family protein N-acetyltransferase
MEFLYHLSMDEPNNAHWRYHGVVVSKEEFARNLWPGIFSQFVVLTKKRSERVGLVVAYQADLHSGHLYLGGVMQDRFKATGLSQEAFSIFMSYLSENWRIRKFYFEFPVFNEGQFAGALGEGMQEEARLRNHSYYGGKLWDLRILSICPEPVP